jgi:hypothetical protein
LVFSAEPEERAEVDGYGGRVQSERQVSRSRLITRAGQVVRPHR